MKILIENLDEDSPFKIAFGGREIPLHADLSVGMWNEIKAMRGDLWTFLGDAQFPFNPVLRPSEQKDQAEQVDVMRVGHDDVMAQLRG